MNRLQVISGQVVKYDQFLQISVPIVICRGSSTK